MDSNLPGNIPPELIAIFRQQTAATRQGNIERALALQDEANQILQLLEAPAQKYPREYFELMYELFNLDAEDAARHAAIQAQLDELYREMGIEIPELPEIPAECQALIQRMQELNEAGRHREVVLASRDYDRCLEKHGIPTQHMPDEFYELQAAAMDAMQNGDMVSFHTLMARVEQMKLDFGHFNIINQIV